MWDLKAFPGKFLRIRPTEIDFESNFSSTSQHLRSTEYSNFLIAKKIEDYTLNMRMISAVYHNNLIVKYLSDCWKILRIRLLILNLGVISAVITGFIIQELSDCRKFLRIRLLRLNVRTISAVYLSVSIYIEYLPDCYIRVTVLLEHFDLLR